MARTGILASLLALLLVAALLPLPGAAQPAGSGPSASTVDRTERARLFEALRAAPNERAARVLEDAIWRLWMVAPDTETGRLLKAAMSRRESYDFAGARELLDKAAERAPTYAEIFNQRGFVRFLQEDYDGALEDVDRAIELEPRHFAAMAGRVMILMRQGRAELAQKQLREAVAIDPFLKERALLIPAPSAPAAPNAPRGLDL
ncbi:tetratricopeptide repeat protein [Aurantimonas sp. VKM B-3413]|uniref:tetratricopeptide repeat protein n=1 Tax=Aurantimonas sp. VKM B-3413 TaxID=2779401 RepID=UPI001E5C7688|nr:tetratricopeptide repeat protein [Aurantimonas sp. VKM B-3413]MCB8837814.1 tetratricopeptide repeat protein [Aurantimonas sp. VKM B-3413]